jgi:xanthine/CO dehydrogenase XdhC/CoxF family maturation factor
VQEILSELERWRQDGEEVVVATVVANRRTAPRPRSRMRAPTTRIPR